MLGSHEMHLGFSCVFYNAGGLELGNADIMHGRPCGSVDWGMHS